MSCDPRYRDMPLVDEHGAPLIHIGYASEKVAKDGKVAMEALLGNADFIVSVNGNFH